MPGSPALLIVYVNSYDLMEITSGSRNHPVDHYRGFYNPGHLRHQEKETHRTEWRLLGLFLLAIPCLIFALKIE